MFDRLKFFSLLNERGGSGILPLMFSTIGGGLFLFSFYNLTQFTAAKSAADQAVRKVARCLSASDSSSSCRSVLADSEQVFSNSEWFGYPVIDGPSEVQIDSYRYSGQVYRDIYGAQYNSYEVNTSNHSLEWNEKRIRPSRFIGLLNSYAVLRADVSATFQRQLVAGGPIEYRTCRVNNRIEVPFGIDFTNSLTYVQAGWCNGVNFRTEDPSCSDLDGSWQASTNFLEGYPCQLELPQRGGVSSTDVPQPWLLLGGSPVCHTDPIDRSNYGVPSSLGLTFSELDNYYRNFFGSGPVPGGAGRPFPITDGRQFVVITVYSCNPSQFLSRVSASIRNANDLISSFNSRSSISLPGFQSDPFGDFSANNIPQYENAFLYSGAPGMSFIAPQVWTYLAWHRRTGDVWRSLTRKVCEWVSFDDAQRRYEEFLPLNDPRNPFSRASNPSGLDLFQLPELVFVDTPSCLNPVNVPIEETRFMCQNATITGQPGSFDSCEGWQAFRGGRHALFQSNLQNAVNLNSNPSWRRFEDLPRSGFNINITPTWSSVLRNGTWNFSWTSDRFMGVPIVNQSAVQARLGYNPKELRSEFYVTQYRKRDNSSSEIERREQLIDSIIRQEGVGEANLNEVFDINSFFNEINISNENVPIRGVWPFIQDDSAEAIPQPRPYFVSQDLFDYRLDCSPTSDCYIGGVPQFQNLEQALRFYANAAIDEVDLTNNEYLFEFNEVRDRVRTMTMGDFSPNSYPACTQFRSNCSGRGKKGELTSLGSYSSMPDACKSGAYLDCFTRYDNSDPDKVTYVSSINEEYARLIALGEIRKIMPGAVFCENGSQSGCINLEIEEEDKEVRVDLSFIAPLTTPFKEILSSSTLVIHSTKRELLEVDRFKSEDKE